MLAVKLAWSYAGHVQTTTAAVGHKCNAPSCPEDGIERHALPILRLLVFFPSPLSQCFLGLDGGVGGTLVKLSHFGLSTYSHFDYLSVFVVDCCPLPKEASRLEVENSLWICRNISI